jgi:nanoRNase/pAp phosphatase (c-di-AMP/oligoRNAs hydrolase)
MESKTGVFLVVTDDNGLVSTLAHTKPRGMQMKVWCPNKVCHLQTEVLEACAGISSSKGAESIVAKGDILNPNFFAKWIGVSPFCVVLALKDIVKHAAVRALILGQLPDAKILTLRFGGPPEMPRKFDNDRELVLSWGELLGRPIKAELRHIQSTHCVNGVRRALEGGDKIALLLQPDPDPDGLAAALALRTLLGRNKSSTPICAFGKVTRPENLAMIKLLDLDVHTITPDELAGFDRVGLLDTQPSHLGVELPRVDAVIDHHPERHVFKAEYKDVRPHYGATSTIMTEYLNAAAIPIGQRLATALLYGIKADTLILNREVIDADLDAFVSLYPKINYNILRRIEKPELPLRFAPILAAALKSMEIDHGILVSFLGPVEREDLIPQIADFLLQFEDAEWVACAGIFEEQIVVSIRNVGYVKSAGEVVKRIISDFGLGGGHRTMAKAIIPLSAWKSRYHSVSANVIRSTLLELFKAEAL